MLTTIGNAVHGSFDDELELMRRIKTRDAEALEELYDLYKRLLFSIILSIVKKREEAENLLQEVFVQIWDNADSFNGDLGNVYGWILTLTRSKAIDRIRSKGNKVRQMQYFSEKEDHYDPMETTIYSDRAELVKKALKEIPSEQREILKIAYYRGLTQSEIANNLGLPIGTVKNRTRQGMIKLNQILGDYISTDA